KVPGIDDHAVADDRKLARTHDARGEQRELVDLAVDDERMAGIVAALEAHDDVGALRKPVHDLALALVAPLGADNHHVRHCQMPLLRSAWLREGVSPTRGGAQAQNVVCEGADVAPAARTGPQPRNPPGGQPRPPVFYG